MLKVEIPFELDWGMKPSSPYPYKSFQIYAFKVMLQET